MTDAGDILTRFRQSSRPEGFKWWYKILWFHYGRLDLDLRTRVDEIAMQGDHRIDLKRYRIEIEEEKERVKKLDGAINLAALEEACSVLSAFTDRERVRDEPQIFELDSFLFSLPAAGTSFPNCLINGPHTNGIIENGRYPPHPMHYRLSVPMLTPTRRLLECSSR
jgi:hypothetical protein